MNIDEIRAEIPTAMSDRWGNRVQWIKDHGKPDYPDDNSSHCDYSTAARILVDMAYEAGQNYGANYDRGVKYGYDKGFEAGKAEQLGKDRKTGEQIIAEMREQYEIGFEAGKADCQRCNKTGYQDGFDDAAKDSTAWYVLDKNGEKVHIGDQVKHDSGRIKTIKGLGESGAFSTNTTFMNFKEWQKVTPDTREKIKEELIRCLAKDTDEVPDDITCGDLAEQFISRIEALGE